MERKTTKKKQMETLAAILEDAENYLSSYASILRDQEESKEAEEVSLVLSKLFGIRTLMEKGLIKEISPRKQSTKKEVQR